MPAVWVPGRLDAACLGATSESLLYEVFGLSKHFFKFLKIKFFYSPITFPTLLYHEVVGLTKYFSFRNLGLKKIKFLKIQFFYSPITFPTLLYEVFGLTNHFSFKYLRIKKNEILRLGRYINIRYISMYRID